MGKPVSRYILVIFQERKVRLFLASVVIRFHLIQHVSRVPSLGLVC